MILSEIADIFASIHLAIASVAVLVISIVLFMRVHHILVKIILLLDKFGK